MLWADWQSYGKDNFDVSGYFDSKISLNPRPLSRLKNQLSQAINEHKIFPRIIVIIPDADIANFLATKGVHCDHSKNIEWLCREFHCEVENYKDKLPAKSKKPNCPSMLWIKALLHVNFDKNEQKRRILFKSCLAKTTVLFESTWALPLKKVWDPKACGLYLK